MTPDRRFLPRYLDILDGMAKPGFKRLGTELAWRIAQAEGMLGRCDLCERRCGADRTAGQGYCKSPATLAVSGHHVIAEEDLSFLVPNYSVFFLGCPLRCVFCQNPENSGVTVRKDRVTETDLARAADQHTGCKNIQFVGGDPLPQLPFALRILSHVRRDVPMVWNSAFYMTEEAMELLRGAVDVYCPDFKFGNDDCAKRLAGVNGYVGTVERNLHLAAADSEMVVCHLVMPNHFECCTRRVIDSLADNFGDGILVHFLSEYTPEHMVREFPRRYPGMNRRLRMVEFRQALRYAEHKGISYVEDC